MADTKVVADLVVRTKGSEAAVKKLSKSVGMLTKHTKAATSAFSTMKGNLAAIATSGALFTIAHGMRNIVRSATEYHAFMDRTRIGLRTIMGQVEQVNGETLGFARAGALARQEFEKIRRPHSPRQT